jgi:hypothetical protein
MEQLTAQFDAQALVLIGNHATLASHPQGEGRYDRQGTPRAALSCPVSDRERRELKALGRQRTAPQTLITREDSPAGR